MSVMRAQPTVLIMLIAPTLPVDSPAPARLVMRAMGPRAKVGDRDST